MKFTLPDGRAVSTRRSQTFSVSLRMPLTALGTQHQASTRTHFILEHREEKLNIQRHAGVQLSWNNPVMCQSIHPELSENV